MPFSTPNGYVGGTVNAKGVKSFAGTLATSDLQNTYQDEQEPSAWGLLSGVLVTEAITAVGLLVSIGVGLTYYARTVWIAAGTTQITVANITQYLWGCADGVMRLTTTDAPPGGFDNTKSCLLARIVGSGGSCTITQAGFQQSARYADPATRQVIDGALLNDSANGRVITQGWMPQATDVPTGMVADVADGYQAYRFGLLTIEGALTVEGSLVVEVGAAPLVAAVTSVALAAPGIFTVSGSPVTSSGALTFSLNAQAANTFFAGPASGGSSAPGFRAIVPADLPVFVASGASHAIGAVPDPGASAGATRYLREDSSWAVPPGVNGVAFSNVSVPGGNTVANTTSETAFASNFTIPANSLAVGQVIRVKAFGVYSTDTISAGNITLRVKFGSTTLCATAALTNVVSLTNQGWTLDALLIVDTTGATGTVEAQGMAFLTTAINTAMNAGMTNTSTVVVDTTANQTVQISVQWSAASANNSIVLRQLVVSSGV